jgi:hypothetical protein
VLSSVVFPGRFPHRGKTMRHILGGSMSLLDRIRGTRARNQRDRVRFRPAPEALESRTLLSSVMGSSSPIHAASTLAGSIAGRLDSVHLDSQSTDPVEIDIDDTPDQGDNITLLNPSTTSQPYAQTIPVRITNLGSTEGVFQLSVDPPVAATLGKTSLDLAAATSTEVTVTPEADSSEPNDVHIIATQGNIQVGEDTMTIVSVTFPRDIRNADTPAAMVDRIPPRVDTPIQVQVTPDLSRSGLSIGVAVLNQDASHGTVTLDGGSTATIASSGTVNIRGITQTAFPALAGDFTAPYAGKLQLALEVRGTATVQSNGFSVAAIPQNFSESFLAPARGQWRGIVVQVAWSSDSGVIADLDAVQIEEEVEMTSAQGVFAGIGVETGDWWGFVIGLRSKMLVNNVPSPCRAITSAIMPMLPVTSRATIKGVDWGLSMLSRDSRTRTPFGSRFGFILRDE